MSSPHRSSTSRWSRRTVLQFGLGMAGAVALPGAMPAHAAGGWDAVSAAIERALIGNLKGVSLIVVGPDRTLFREAFGTALIQISTILASASMAPSALAMLALADQGALSLDDPLSRYIPAFTGEKKAITIRQCLSHTSGIADDGALLTPPAKDPGMSLEEEVDRAAKKKLMHKPGAAFSFGGMSYQAAGRAAEAATGQPWPLLFQNTVNEPLGVNFTFGETSDPRLAAGASASLASYGALLQLLLNEGEFNGVKVLSRASAAELKTNQLGALSNATPPAAGRTAAGYGLGWWLESLNAKRRGTRINAAGAFGTIPWIDFERGYGAVLMLQDDLKTGERLAAALRPLIESALRE